MGTIGIRELKLNLSATLRRVREGEAVTITDRGRAIATLNPVSDPVPEWLRAMVASGEVHWRGGKPAGVRGVRLRGRGKTAAEYVLDQRR